MEKLIVSEERKECYGVIFRHWGRFSSIHTMDDTLYSAICQMNHKNVVEKFRLRNDSFIIHIKEDYPFSLKNARKILEMKGLKIV